jgi:hypothetical protein
MLHRIALRVLPSLTLAVTEPKLRKRKRILMLVAGLAAFALYRAAKPLLPFDAPLVLLTVSGLLCAITAMWAYRAGRQAGWKMICREEKPARLAWIAGWIGFVYGVQLALLVLALLRILVHYDFLRHPDGPAMMALIIASTSVARDAFEIGSIRRLQVAGRPMASIPCGVDLWTVRRKHPAVTWWVCLSAGMAGLLAGGLAQFEKFASASGIVELAAATLFAGTSALAGYLAAWQPSVSWPALVRNVGWRRLMQFWWWPGLAFAATYYCVLFGIVTFVFRWNPAQAVLQGVMAGIVAGMMPLYGYVLGHRRRQEDQAQKLIPDSLLRCPFVLSILSSRSKPHAPLPTVEVFIGEPRPR